MLHNNSTKKLLCLVQAVVISEPLSLLLKLDLCLFVRFVIKYQGNWKFDEPEGRRRIVILLHGFTRQ